MVMDIMRKRFTIELAGLLIEIDAGFTSACVLCRDYLKEGQPDIRIRVTEEDVERELMENGKQKYLRVSAETGAVYHKIADAVLHYNTLLMHGAVVAIGNDAYMFCAPSGTGKTTHVGLWLKNRRDAIIINGDKPLIRVSEGDVLVYGTPWSGSENLNVNTSAHLKAIVFMERAENNMVEEISFAKAYPSLWKQTYIPQDEDLAHKALSLLLSIGGRVPVYRFRFNNFKDDCFRTAYDALVSGDNKGSPSFHDVPC